MKQQLLNAKEWSSEIWRRIRLEFRVEVYIQVFCSDLLIYIYICGLIWLWVADVFFGFATFVFSCVLILVHVHFLEHHASASPIMYDPSFTIQLAESFSM